MVLGLPETNPDVDKIAVSLLKQQLFSLHSGMDPVAQNSYNPFIDVRIKSEPIEE